MRKPNIVFVLTDDQGYGDLGCTGNPIIKTPNIDSFYESSARFTNFHVGPTCAPTRAGLMTGHYANSTGVWHTIGGRSLLREDEWTLATALSENGYDTGIFGKWHLGDTYPYRPEDRGFNTAVTHGGGGISQTPDYWGNDYFDDTYFVNGEPTMFEGYCSDVFFREGMKFIEKNKDNPFLCYIACNAPHSPYNVPKKYYDMYKDSTNDDRARFYGMISNIDDNFGKLQQKLAELDILDDTVLIFMTDNGTSCGFTQDDDQFLVEGYNAGLRGMKNSPYDGGHRTPFILSWPNGDINTECDINQVTANVDFMPTLLDICGIEPREEKPFHGTSLLPMLKGEDLGYRVLVTDSQRNVYPKKWKRSAVMTNRWRLINGVELYNINKDREQRNDVALTHPKIVGILRREYSKWWDIVSKQYDEEIPIHIGQNPATFTSHDIRNDECDSAWHQGFIRRGQMVNGYWETMVEEAGSYSIELRRWPREAGHNIISSPGDNDIAFDYDNIQESNHFMYSGGVELDIVNAEVEIFGIKQVKDVAASDNKVVFNLDLPKGSTNITGTFTTKDGKKLAPYYIYITKNTNI